MLQAPYVGLSDGASSLQGGFAGVGQSMGVTVNPPRCTWHCIRA